MSKIETSGESKLGLRLDRILGASASCAAAAAGVGLVGPSDSADAAIIYSGPVSIPVPANIDGVYLNVVTGATGTSGALAGWDINPYSAGVAIDFNLFSPGGANGGWFAIGTTFVHNGPGVLVNGAGTFANQTSAALSVAPQVTLNSSNYLGFRFLNESTGVANFGWINIAFGADTSIRTIREYAYENTGGSIVITAVPEPSTMCLLATGAVGLFAARRRRALAKAKA